jgi:hypothetical protein
MPGLKARNRVRIAVAVVAAMTVAGLTAAAIEGSAEAAVPARAFNAASLDALATAAHVHPGRVALALVRAAVRATVRETGLSAATVTRDVRTGKTLDQIAGAKHPAVEQDVLALVLQRLNRAVARHRITAQQEQQVLANAKSALDKLMSSDLSKRLHNASRQSNATTSV